MPEPAADVGRAGERLFLDVSLRAAGFALPFKALVAMGIERVALHTSKYQGDDLLDAARGAGVGLVTPYSVYYGALAGL